MSNIRYGVAMNYADDLAMITVLVTHLGTCKVNAKSAKQLAKDLTLYLEEVKRILKHYPELFIDTAKNNDYQSEKTYTLHLRYALACAENGNEQQKVHPPIEPEHLSALLAYIDNKFANDIALKRQKASNIVALSCAIVASLAAVYTALN